MENKEKIFTYRGSNYLISKDWTCEDIIKELEELEKEIIKVVKNSPNQVFKGHSYDIADILYKGESESNRGNIAEFVSTLNDEGLLKEIYMIKGDYCNIHGALKNIFIEKCIVLPENKDFDHVNLSYEKVSSLIEFM